MTSATGGVAAVDRALSILDAFRTGNGKLTLSEIAQITGLYKSTALRLIASLEASNYLVRLANGQYQLGHRIGELGGLYSASFSLRDHIEPVLQALATHTKESCSFFIKVDKYRQCLYRVESQQLVRDHLQIGALSPLGPGASGKTLLHFAEGYPAVGIKRDAFLARSVAERHPDMASLSGPVFSREGALLGAIAISGPMARLNSQTLDILSTPLIEHLIQLNQRFGLEINLIDE